MVINLEGLISCFQECRKASILERHLSRISYILSLSSRSELIDRLLDLMLGGNPDSLNSGTLAIVNPFNTGCSTTELLVTHNNQHQ